MLKPIGWIGVALFVAGGIVLAMRGISYTKDRQTMEMGPVSVSAEQKGFVPPYVGFGLLVVGAALIFTGRRKGS